LNPVGGRNPLLVVYASRLQEGKSTNLDQWSNKQCVCQDDGSILVRAGDTKTNRDFGSYKLHVEFRMPFMPAGRGQGRGNISHYS
jgi:hypothetical protein